MAYASALILVMRSNSAGPDDGEGARDDVMTTYGTKLLARYVHEVTAA